MATTIFSTNFSSTNSQPLPVTCGVPDSVLSGISNRYIVTISATKANAPQPYLIVNAYLQDKFELNAGSQWEDLSQMFGGISDVADTVTQGVTALATGTARSLVAAASTRRKWKGSQPVKLKLKLVFEAFTNPYTEVILPVMRLQQLSLPAEGNNNKGGFFLIPPGPSPFDIGNTIKAGNTIELSLGGFLNFTYNYCGGIVIDDVTVTYENRMGKAGPIGASVILNASTYQMLTQEALQRIHGIGSTSQTTASTPGPLGTPAPGNSAGQ